jgi:hypothetical protein
LTTSDPSGLIAFECSDLPSLQRYQFGSLSAEFLVCRRCGVYLGAQLASDGRRWGILNVRTLTPVPADLPGGELMDYEEETPEIRRRRREARWTPVASDSL